MTESIDLSQFKLTPLQEVFCLEYAVDFNQTVAYQRAQKRLSRDVSEYDTAASAAFTMLNNIEVSKASTVEFINTIGQLVERYHVESNACFDISNLSKGIYFARITDVNGKVYSQKILVE